MYIEISEYFFLFDVNISSFFVHLNNGFIISDFNLEWDLHYTLIREYFKFMVVRFFVIFDPNRHATVAYRGDLCELIDRIHLFNIKKRL
jgi:hypothetical protein